MRPRIRHQQPTTCIDHDAIDVSSFEQEPGTTVICGHCGHHLMSGQDDGWRIADTKHPGGDQA